ncbi:amidohydrolase [Telmatospirillum sp. J64-1]|uniref:amidohydrolase family protein n=1 Tax=Telmatospirillum sp. J64-1 TaxID=2502183 RepID=UPI00115F1079|nr:amidohydrolase family protein [Telmatospirillum sp. J64-1]
MSGFDCHVHVFSADSPVVSGARYRPAQAAPLDAWQRNLRENRLRGGVIVQVSFLGYDNSQLVEALRQAGENYRGIAMADPAGPVEDLEALAEAGVVGLRWNLVQNPNLPDPKAEPWKSQIAQMKALGWHLQIQLEGPRLPALLPALLETGLTVVVDHLGLPAGNGPAEDEGFRTLLDAAAEERLWVKLSAPYRSQAAADAGYAKALLEAIGPERLVWGSDWPWTRFEDRHDYAQTLGWLAEWVPDDAARHQILDLSPRRLYGFKG